MHMANEIMLVPLHEKPYLLHGCIKLLNNEWPRSETARFDSLVVLFYFECYSVIKLLNAKQGPINRKLKS